MTMQKGMAASERGPHHAVGALLVHRPEEGVEGSREPPSRLIVEVGITAASRVAKRNCIFVPAHPDGVPARGRRR